MCHVPKCAFHSSSPIEILEMNFLYLLCSALTRFTFLFYLCCVCWCHAVNAIWWYGSTFDRKQCQFPINYNIFVYSWPNGTKMMYGVRSEEKTCINLFDFGTKTTGTIGDPLYTHKHTDTDTFTMGNVLELVFFSDVNRPRSNRFR